MKRVTCILTALLAVLLVGSLAFSAEATEAAPVAQVLRSGEPVESYATVQEAFDAAADAEDLSVKLLQNVEEAAEVTGTVYLDLAGYDLQGITITGTLYCMDTTTDQYRGSGAGLLTAKSGEPQLHVKTTEEQTGSIKRYLRVKESRGYSFHRYYMGVTHMVLDPENNGMGYRATFAGDTWVKGVLSKEDTYGVVVGLSPLEETLEGQNYRNGDLEQFFAGSAFTRKLTIANILSGDAMDNAARGQMSVYARAYIRLKDGTLLFSSQVENDLQTLMEAVNAQWDRYTPTQQAKVATMLATAEKQISHWNVASIHHQDTSLWTPWTGTWEDGGHYYLTEDVSLTSILEIAADTTVDICLNGHDIIGDTALFRIFRIKGTLNLHDHRNSDGSFSGDVVSNYTKYSMGPVFYVHERGEFNLCGGNLKYEADAYASRGGVGMLGNANEANDYAYMNMYNGTISGGKVEARWNTEENAFLEQGGGFGGNLELCAYSIFNMYGGTISGGEVHAGMKDETTAISVNNGNGGNLCIGSESIVNLYGGTITGGTAYGLNTGVSGKGGNICNHGVLNLYDGTVSDGTADANGGNIYSNGTVNMYGGTVKDAKPGDALYGGNFFISGTLNMENGIVADGIASKAGGNIYIGGGEVYIKGGQIYGGGGYDNTAGGNIRLNAGTLEISGGKIWGGISDYDGYLEGEQSNISRGGCIQMTSGTFKMTGGSIGIDAEGNLAGGQAGCGGNLNVQDGTVTISGGSIAGGTAVKGGNLNVQEGTVTLSGGDIYGGLATAYGGNLFVEGAADVTISGADIYNGSAYYNEAGGNLYVNAGSVTLSEGKIWGGVADAEGNTGSDAAVSGANVLVSGGELRMTGGSIGVDDAGNSVGGSTGKGLAVGRGANLYVMDTGAVTLTGGTIAGGKAVYGGGIYLKAGSLTLSQTPSFSENEVGDVYLAPGTTMALGDEGLAVSTPISVVAEEGVFATGIQTDLSGQFTSGAKYLVVGYDEEAKALKLYDPEMHTHCICAGVPVNDLAEHTCTDILWKAFPKVAVEAAEAGYVLKEGNYCLKEDVTFTGTENITIPAGATVRICLNGHKLESDGRFFVRGTLEVTDCSYDAADGSFHGSMVANAAGKDGAIATSFHGARINIYGGNFTSKVVAGNGGLFYVSNQNGEEPITAETVMNIYNGKLYGGSAVKGGNIYVAMAKGATIPSVLNMYGGEISGGLATNEEESVEGGNICCAGTMNMYGGTVKDPQVGTAVYGGNIYVTGTLTVDGTAVIANGIASKAGGNIYINGGTVYVKNGQIYGGGAYDNTAGGNIRLNAGTLEISGGKIWGGISDYDGYTAGSQNGASRGGCIQMTNGTFKMTGGSIGIDASGNAAGGQAAYGGNLNVQAGTVTISGGTIANGTANKGGNLNFQAGTVTLSGGDIDSGIGKYYGGNLFVEGAADVTISGADIYNGGAYYNEAGGNLYMDAGTVTLSGGRIWGGVADAEGNTGSDAAVAGANVLVNAGTFNMTSGAVGVDADGNSVGGSTGKGLAVGKGANLYVMGTGTVSITGGAVAGGNAIQGGGIYLKEGTLSLSRTPIFSENNNGDIYLASGARIVIGDGGLTVGAPISVVTEDDVFATNVQTDLSSRFVSGTQYLSVGYDAQAKTLYLYDPETHTHCACADVSVNTLAKHTCTQITWQPFPKAAVEAAETGYTLKEGNYYLKENVTYTGTGNITIAANTKVRICLNGYKLESNSRFFVRGDLEVTDCSYNSADGSFDGSMVANAAGVDGAIATSFHGARINIYGGNFTSKAVAGNGGLFYVSNQNGTGAITKETVMNIYNGKFYGGRGTAGGNIYVSMASGSEIPAVLNIYGGEISGGLATKGSDNVYGGNVYSAGTVNMYGGTVKDSQAGTAVYGGNFCITGTLNFENGVIANGRASKSGGNIYINGGTVYVKNGQIYGGGAYDNTAGGNIRLNAGTLEISGGKIWGGISDYDGYTAGSQNGNSRGGCIQMTNGTFKMTGGSIGIDASGKAAGGQAAYGGNLNVQDGTVTISGGTITGGTASRGGNINFQAGTVTISGGDIYGGLAKSYGGNLFVEGAADVTISGADIYNGSAYYNEAGANIYVNAGTLTLASGRIWGGVADAEGNAGSDDAVAGANVLVNAGTFNMTGGSIGINDKGGIAAGSTGKGLPVGRGANLHVMNTGVANIRGGTISGGTAMRGGNICVISTLNIYGGTITGGTATGGTTGSGTKINGEGGNICNLGELNVYGGTIKNGTATGGFGGNIYSRDFSTNKLHLEGATITGGKATPVMENGTAVIGTGLGGGVYTGLVGVELAGNLQITGNTDSDLYLKEEATVVSTGLVTTARIGITEEYAVCLAEDASLVNCFISRMDGHTAGVVNGKVFMVKTGLDTAAVAKKVSTFSVGYAMTDINPKEEGIQMSAWGNPNGRYTKGQGYPLYATTIAITDQNNTTVLMITADLQGFDSLFTDRVFTRISQATGVPKENIYLSTTHTHNAPDVKKQPEQNKRYALYLFDQLIHSAMDAMADRAPATMKTGSFDTVGMNFTRHYYYLDSKGQKVYFGDQFGQAPSSGTKIYRVLEGDPTMHMVAFDRTGKQDVLLTNWRAHPHRSGGMEKYEVDADVIGAWREYMHKNTDYLFAFFQGAAGNTNTRSRISGETYEDGKIKEYGDEMGRQLIKNGLPKLKATNTGLIQVKKITYAATVDHSEDNRVDDAQALMDYYYGYPDQMDTYAEQIAKAKEYGLTSVFHAQRILDKSKQGETSDLDLNIFSIGNSIGFYTGPGELWSSFSEMMEKESPFPMTFYMGYCNGRVGYIPYQVEYSSYEYHFCMYTQQDTINEMKQIYLDELKKQYNAAK